jgi:hypothetical protein
MSPVLRTAKAARVFHALLLACGLAASARAQLIDDFSSGNLSTYTKSVVLEQDATNAVFFTSPSGALQVGKTSGTTAEQVLFLRDDYSLGVGQILRVDTAVTNVSPSYADFGIAVSATVNPPNASTAADLRRNYITVYAKGSTGAIGYIGFNGTNGLGGSAGVTPTGGFAALLGLYIKRTTATSFDVGYTTASGDTLLNTYTVTNTAIGTAVGFYADVRTVFTYPGKLDNLRLEAIPTNGPPPGFTGVPVTYIPVDDGDTNTSEYGYAGSSSINAAAFIKSSLSTVSNQQFLAYYYRHQTDATDTNNNKIVIARRDISTKVWEIFRTSFTAFDITDGHDVVCFGIDGEGVMHLSWGMHNNTLNYARSTGPVLGTNTITFGSILPMTGGEVTNTYPQFLTLPNGDLLFFGRRGGPGGGSGGGDQYLNRWKLSTHTWTNVNMTGGVFQPFIRGYWSAATNYNAYLNMPCMDTNGNLFLTWTWRETPAYQSNHDLFYAQSPDGGVTWQRSDNTAYTLPICQYGINETGTTNSVPEKVVSIPQNSSLINQAGMCLDGNNDPVIATWWAPGTATNNYRRQYMVAFPDSNGVWQVRQVSNRTNDPVGTLQLDSAARDLGRPVVVADRDNRLLVLYRDNFGSNGLTVAHSLPYAVDPLRTNWTTIDLTYDNLGSYEPVIDLPRWERDNVLSILYQPASGLGYAPPANTASQVAVVEWDAAAYFNHKPAVQIAVTNQDVTLSWPSQTGWSYKVQTSTNLVSWTNLGTLAGNGATRQFIHTNAAADSVRFWRLQVQEGGASP